MFRRAFGILAFALIALLSLSAQPAHAACTALTNGVVPLARFDSAGAHTAFTQVSGTAPEGIVAYDTVNDLLKVCDGSAWQTAGGGGGGSGQWVDGTAGAIYYNGGNVGIGTATPSSKLSIGGSAGATIWSAFSGSSRYASLATGNTNGVLTITAGSDNNAVTAAVIVNSKGYNDTPLTIRNIFAVQNNATEKFTITSGGNVGIGTTSPGAKLAVNIDGATGDGISSIDSSWEVTIFA